MPTNRRRRLHGRREPLSDALRHHMLTGEYPQRNQFDSWAEVWLLRQETQRELWQQHTEELLAQWIRDRPGARPWAWWRWDAPDARRCVRGAELLLPTHAPGDWEWCWRGNFGIPAFAQSRPSGFDGYPAVESQAAYLSRHDLLHQAERARLDAGALEPEAIDPFVTDVGELEELKARGEARRAAERLAMHEPTNGHRHSTTHAKETDR